MLWTMRFAPSSTIATEKSLSVLETWHRPHRCSRNPGIRNPAWHSVSQSSTVVSKGSGYVEFARIGHLVSVTVYNVLCTLSDSWGSALICEVPDEYRPRDQVRAKCAVQESDYDYSTAIWCNKQNLYAVNLGGTGLRGTYSLCASLCWHRAG